MAFFTFDAAVAAAGVARPPRQDTATEAAAYSSSEVITKEAERARQGPMLTNATSKGHDALKAAVQGGDGYRVAAQPFAAAGLVLGATTLAALLQVGLT